MVEDTAVDWPSLVSNHRNVADVDGIFDILGHPKRREVIRLLADLPEEKEVELHNLSRAVACIVYDVSYKELEHWQYSQIRQNLRKHGLVPMSIANIIDYDRAEQTVRRGPSFAPAARVLHLIDQRDWPDGLSDTADGHNTDVCPICDEPVTGLAAHLRRCPAKGDEGLPSPND